MELREIEYLLTIYETGSIRGAAERLMIAQPSLSQFLSQYESELGTKLFLRTSRGVVPTPAGEIFLADAQKIRNIYHSSMEQMHDISKMKTGTVRLGISTFRAQSLLPPALKKFYELYPDVTVQITELDSILLENSILDGSLDLGVVAFPLRKLKNDANVELLINDEVVVAAKKDHPVHRYVHTDADGRTWVDFKDAARFEFILGDVNTRLGHIARQLFSACKKAPIVKNENISAALALAMARRGLGLCLTYASVTIARGSTEYLSIGRDGVYLELALAFPPSGYRSKATRELARIMHEEIGEL